MTGLCQTHSEALPVQRWASTACWRGGLMLALLVMTKAGSMCSGERCMWSVESLISGT